MSMNVGSGSGSEEPEVMMDINTTPLIDVMLVLLVMLIITIPQPEVHIRPNKGSRYAVFANVLSTSKRKGLTKMAVVGSEQFIQ